MCSPLSAWAVTRKSGGACRDNTYGEVGTDLLEWDDGEYEGRRAMEIRKTTLCVLLYKHDLSEPAIRLSNDTRHGAA